MDLLVVPLKFLFPVVFVYAVFFLQEKRNMLSLQDYLQVIPLMTHGEAGESL